MKKKWLTELRYGRTSMSDANGRIPWLSGFSYQSLFGYEKAIRNMGAMFAHNGPQLQL